MSPSSLPVQRLSDTEVCIAGRKYLYRQSNLYTIRDRESDDDYDPDEDWTFEAWCGPQVHDLAVLQHWITFLTAAPSPPSSVEPVELPTPPPVEPTAAEPTEEIQKQTKRWVPAGTPGVYWALTVTTTSTGVHFFCSLGSSVWMAEYTHAEIVPMAERLGYYGTLEEVLEALHFGVGCTNYMPILNPRLGSSVDNNQLELEIALESCEEYTFVAWFNLEAKQIPSSLLRLLVSQMPPKPVAEAHLPASTDSPASTIVLEEDEEEEELEPIALPAPVVQTKTKGSVFSFKGSRK